MRYRVDFYMDNEYSVIEIQNLNYDRGIEYHIPEDECPSEFCVFQGSLSDCEAYINLNEQGYM